MRAKLNLYVASIVGLAFLGTLVTYRTAPASIGSTLTDALLLCGLAIAAELFAFILPRSAAGTIAFIPYFAAAIAIPSWPSVVSVVVVKIAVELWLRREFLKATLNIAAHALMQLVGIWAFLALGGVGLVGFERLRDLTHVTRISGFPALVAIVLALLTNNLIVHGAIAISSGRSLREVVTANKRTTIGLDFIAAPLVFVFAWVYSAFGPIAAASLWVPILGLRQFHRTNLELEQTNTELLELMVKSIEARDPYTSGHSRRVQQFSTIIARAIGLSERAIEEVGHAALLHDVGKIHEKYAGVLSKQDKLSSEEWTLIKEHPADGAELVATMTRLRDLVPAVRHHHENWDGTGYPDRIAGVAIPIAARIIRFADTIDAMTTERPYRGPLSEAQVRAEVLRCRGTQFDPVMTDRLLASSYWQSLFTPASNSPSIAAEAKARRGEHKQAIRLVKRA
jgi:hypothetical protein